MSDHPYSPPPEQGHCPVDSATTCEPAGLHHHPLEPVPDTSVDDDLALPPPQFDEAVPLVVSSADLEMDGPSSGAGWSGLLIFPFALALLAVGWLLLH